MSFVHEFSGDVARSVVVVGLGPKKQQDRAVGGQPGDAVRGLGRIRVGESGRIAVHGACPAENQIIRIRALQRRRHIETHPAALQRTVDGVLPLPPRCRAKGEVQHQHRPVGRTRRFQPGNGEVLVGAVAVIRQ